MDGVLLEELGFLFEVYHCNYEQAVLIAFVDDLMFAECPTTELISRGRVSSSGTYHTKMLAK